MRDLIVSLVVVLGCLYTLRKPYIGVLLWSWLSYMNPHRLSWGFAYNMPFAYITGSVLIFSLLINNAIKKPSVQVTIFLWIAFDLFMALTTLFAYYPESAQTYFIRVLKIQLICFISMGVINDVDKIRKLIWVIVASIGFFTIKGGLFTLLTGGGYRVWGPPESMIEGNNEIAIAALMVIPLMLYLHKIQKNRWVKKVLLISSILSFFAAIGSQSRGALIAMFSVSFFFWLKSDRKLFIGIGILSLISAIMLFMPESWFSRMHTIETYDKDASALGRLNAWEYAFNAANQNLLGLGFESWKFETFLKYAPNPFDVHVAHSIYFSLLADHGWIGLILFVAIFFSVWLKLGKVKGSAINSELDIEIQFLAKMIQISLIAYLTGGAFLSLAYYDLPWQLVGIAVVLYDIKNNSQLIDYSNIRKNNK